MQAARKNCVVQALIESIGAACCHGEWQSKDGVMEDLVIGGGGAKSQALKAARKNCVVQALIETLATKGAERQVLKAARKSCIVQALIESIAE